jgi:hypothetical protein
MAIAPIAVRTGTSRGRCNRLWCATSPVAIRSMNGHDGSRTNTNPMMSATHTGAGTV